MEQGRTRLVTGSGCHRDSEARSAETRSRQSVVRSVLSAAELLVFVGYTIEIVPGACASSR